jgi:threonine dehydrogenase-like Zn-dependent dehydrogenase
VTHNDDRFLLTVMSAHGFNQNALPTDAENDQPTLGVIGMGAMGRMYVNQFAKAGWKKIHVCDLPAKYEALRKDYSGLFIIIHKKCFCEILNASRCPWRYCLRKWTCGVAVF